MAKTKGKCKKDKNISLREKKILEIKKKLIEQKQALLAEAGIAINVLPDETAFPELVDQASAEINRNLMLRLKGREGKLLKKIDEALDKINAKNYGICEICGCEIAIERLMARPVTTMCIECKTEQEEEERMRER